MTIRAEEHELSDLEEQPGPARPPMPPRFSSERDRGGDSPRRRRWWNRRVVPTWVVIVLALAAGALAVALIASDDADSGQVTALGSDDTTTTEAPTTTTEATTTTTTTEPTTTTATVSADVAKAAVDSVFDNNRVQIAAIIQDNPNVDTVDSFELDLVVDRIRLDITSPFVTPENQADGAWELTRQLAEPLYSTDGGFFSTPQYTPGFELINSGTTYTCSADFMVRLASFAAGRSDFENEC